MLPFRHTVWLASADMAKPRARAKPAPPNRLTLGIDEAGRGPAVGPMVMAAVALDSRSAAALTRAGLCDSKAYGAGDDARAIRTRFAHAIRQRALFVSVIEVAHTEIDQRVSRRELNLLERVLDQLVFGRLVPRTADLVLVEDAELHGPLPPMRPFFRALGAG